MLLGQQHIPSTCPNWVQRHAQTVSVSSVLFWLPISLSNQVFKQVRVRMQANASIRWACRGIRGADLVQTDSVLQACSKRKSIGQG